MTTLFDIDPELLETTEAKKALLRGKLYAKNHALVIASRLVVISTPLLISVLAVSIVHIWSTLSLVTPIAFQLQLPGQVFIVTALLTTILIDALSLFQVKVKSALKLAGRQAKYKMPEAFFLVLTALLNAAFLLRYTPGVAQQAADSLIWLDWVITILLVVQIPYSIVFTELGHQQALEAKLQLVLETEALKAAIGPEEKQPSWWEKLLSYQELQTLRELAAKQNSQIGNYSEYIESLRKALNGYPDSDLISLAKVLSRNSEEMNLIADEWQITGETVHEYVTRITNENIGLQLENKTLQRELDLAKTPQAPITSTPKKTVQQTQERNCSCGQPLTQSDFLVCGRANWKEKLGGEVKCKSCRNSI